MREHIKGWIKAGHKVTLFSSRFTGSKAYEISGGMEIIHSGDQYIEVKFDAFRYWLKNGSKYDLVVDQFHGIPFFTPLYIRKPKLAVLQEVAGKVWFLNEFPFPFNYLVGLLGYLAEPIIFLFYRRVPFMVGSESAKADLIKMRIPAKNITIIPHGVILPKSKIKYQKAKIKTIAYLGALTKDKGVEDAIRCFSLLGKKYRFWIIGRGAPRYQSQLVLLCRKLKIDKRVKFWGYVDTDKKFELLAKSHVLINPSVHEGWGLVNIEANAVGTPVIAYRSAGLVDSVKDGKSGFVVAKNTPDELAKNVKKILSGSRLYKELQRGAVVWSKNFSWVKSKKLSLGLIEVSKKACLV